MVVPTRGRPEAARTLRETFTRTCRARTQLVFAADADDPLLGDYVRAVFGEPGAADEVGELTVVEDADFGLALLSHRPGEAMLTIGDNDGFTAALNRTSLYFSHASKAFATGCMNDDHVPRTPGWDADFLAALRALGSGFTYGNDLFQGEALPTQLAMTSDIVRVLGFFGPPTFQHMYVDNVWLLWGQKCDRLTYLPDTIIEHLHPLAGKASWTVGHERVNAPEMYAKGQAAFQAYTQGPVFADLGKLDKLMHPDRVR